MGPQLDGALVLCVCVKSGGLPACVHADGNGSVGGQGGEDC